MIIETYAKLVVHLDTTRTKQQIRNALAPVQQEYKTRIQQLIASDPQTTLVDWSYRLKVGRAEVYPKLVLILDTTRTEDQIRSALDPVYQDLKQSIRNLIASDPQTSIVSWHVHLSTGSVDELEP